VGLVSLKIYSLLTVCSVRLLLNHRSDGEVFMPNRFDIWDSEMCTDILLFSMALKLNSFFFKVSFL
jgi:hypothetical protein